MKITLVIGLPASGKTTYAKKLGGFLIDDPKHLDELPDICEHLVIVDPFFCITHILKKSIVKLSEKYGECEITKIYFENDPDQCCKNAELREHKHVKRFINAISFEYEPDESCIVLPCYGK